VDVQECLRLGGRESDRPRANSSLDAQTMNAEVASSIGSHGEWSLAFKNRTMEGCIGEHTRLAVAR
jgi:hypothetical protein